MKILAFLLLILFSNCSSQKASVTSCTSGKEIAFEEIYAYPYSLTTKEFLVIDTQQKMDDVFKIIHQRSPKGRMAPIRSVYEKADETYLIYKPVVKTTNSVQIQKMCFNKGTLTIDVAPYNDPQFNKNTRTQPNVMVKILEKLDIKKININYK